MGRCRKHREHKNHHCGNPPIVTDKLVAKCAKVKCLKADHIKVKTQEVTGSIKSNSVNVPTEFMELPIPDGPFSVDSFQLGTDNTQIPSCFRYLVSETPDIEVTGVKTMIVDAKEYFGEMVEGEPLYLTPPQPIIVTVYVPSKRCHKNKPYPVFASEDTPNKDTFYSENSLIYQLVSDATILNMNNPTTLYQNIRTKVFNFIPPGGNSLAENTRDVDLTNWTGLQGVFLADEPAPVGPDAYDRLVQLKADLNVELDANSAYTLWAKIMGSLGAPVGAPGPNFSVSAADRIQAYEFVTSTSNWANAKLFSGHSKPHGMKSAKVNEVYNPLYNFTNIELPSGKIPLVIAGDPTDVFNGPDLWEKLTSYGIAVALYSHTYTFGSRRIPGKTTSPNDILFRGNALPDIIAQGSGDGNYAPRGEGNPTSGGGVDNIGYIWNDGWTVGNAEAATPQGTGLNSNGFNYGTFIKLREAISNTVDINGVSLTDYIDLENIGVYGRSGGNIIGGAQQYEKIINPDFSLGYSPLEVKCCVAEDILFSYPFWNVDISGYEGAPLVFSGDGGMRFPALFMEPDVDHYRDRWDGYADSGGARYTVGPRKTLQKTIRKTNQTVRSKTIFMEGPSTGHSGGSGIMTSDVRPYSNEWNVATGVDVPNIPEFPNTHYDPVFGFRNLNKNAGTIKYAYANMVALYYRMFFTAAWEGPIYAGMLNMLPFKFDIAPWSIPGALDYSFPLGYYPEIAETAILWDFDVGGEYSMTVDYKNRNLRIGDTDETDKPEIGLNKESVNLKNLPTSPVGLSSGDLWVDVDTIKIVP